MAGNKKTTGICNGGNNNTICGRAHSDCTVRFGSERVATLPLLLYSRMGSYRMYDAAATALLLLLVCLALFRFIESRAD